MKSEWRLFGIVAFFLAITAVAYAVWTRGHYGGVEWIGSTALVLSALLCGMCGGFFWFVSRRIDLRPEDRPDGEIADGAGEVGFFSPGSYWPFALALTATLTGLGLVFWQYWMIIGWPAHGDFRGQRPALRVLLRHPPHRRTLNQPARTPSLALPRAAAAPRCPAARRRSRASPPIPAVQGAPPPIKEILLRLDLATATTSP